MGTITINNKNIKSISIGGKNIRSLTIGGKVLNLQQPGDGNAFAGNFLTQHQQSEFMAITTDVAPYQFEKQTALTKITMPQVQVINVGAFWHSPLTVLTAPLVVSIEQNAFHDATLTSLDLPELTRIGVQAFYESVLTSLSIPKATTISGQAFRHAQLTTIDLPDAILVGSSSFHASPLTNINAPKATNIGVNAFYSVVNSSTTNVTINKKFNTDNLKNSIFGAGHWNQITFHWTNDDGSPYVPPVEGNTFTGTFSTSSKQAEFMAITTTVNLNSFNREVGLTGVSLPKATNIGGYAFINSPLTSLNIPKATVIGVYAFQHIVNAATTHVTMNSAFRDNSKKHTVFGFNNWTNIQFTYV